MTISSPEKTAWRNMRRRCQNPKNPEYKNYGGRGITVCEEWRSFDAFYADMGDRPSPKHSLDRLDVNGPYAAFNCAWRTPVEQLNNMRKNRWLTFEGRTQTVAQWARETGLTPGCISGRMLLGWDTKRILTVPRRQPKPKLGRRETWTSCPRGHVFDTENTGRRQSGVRYCKACNRLRANAARAGKPYLFPKVFGR